VRDEILIRVLRSPMGVRVAQIGKNDSSVQRIGKAVSRLRADHVLKGCPPPEAGWSDVEVSHSPPPECLEERQRVLDAAANTTDLGKRAKMMQSAPTCE